MAKAFAESATTAVKTMTSAWLNSPSPDLTSPTSAVGWLSGRLSYFVLVAMFLGVLYAAYRMATSGQFSHLGDLGHALFKLVAVSGLAAIVTSLCLEIGDEVARWVMTTSPATVSYQLLLGGVTSPGTVILLAVIVILAQIIQLMLMLVKNAMIIGLVAFLPISAAASNTGVGRNSLQKSITWLAAFVLYKPVAAIIYALSFKLSEGEQSFATQMSGLALMILAIFALPAMMRFLVPITASATGGNAGALAGAVVGAAIATGATIATAGGAAAAGGFAGAGSAPATGAVLSSGGAPLASGVMDAAKQQTEESVDK